MAQEPKRLGLVPCAGACNVGSLTHKIVVDEVTKNPGELMFVCALGLPMGLPSVTHNARRADIYLAVNGCEVACASTALECAGLNFDEEIVLTRDIGCVKNEDLMDLEKYSEACALVRSKLSSMRACRKQIRGIDDTEEVPS